MSSDVVAGIDTDGELRLAAGVIRRALIDAARDPEALDWLRSGAALPWVSAITPADRDVEDVIARLIETARHTRAQHARTSDTRKRHANTANESEQAKRERNTNKPKARKRVMTVECGRCGTEYTPSLDSIIAGVWRRACPQCYPVSSPPATPATRSATVSTANEPKANVER